MRPRTGETRRRSAANGRRTGMSWRLGRRLALWLFLCSVLPVLSGCGIYSFSGATLPEEITTVAIPLAEDRTVGLPGLDQQLTDQLVQRFVDRTRLRLEPDEGAADAVLVIVIERYASEPAAVTGDETAALNRLTIEIQARLDEEGRETPRVDRRFSASDTYDPAGGLAGEAALAEELLRRLADDLFTAIASDW